MTLPAISSYAEPEQAFVNSLPLIDRVVAKIIRRHAMNSAEGDEFNSWLRAKIVESDYAVFRKFRGSSSLQTYLTVVISNLFRDYRNEAWGRWRASAEALRHGPIAVRLESLIYRDGLSVSDAIQVIRSRCDSLEDSQLRRLAARLPQRRATTEVSLDELESGASEGMVVPPGVTDGEREAFRAIEEVIRALVGSLTAEDALILRMRFWEDTSVADIARALHLEQKPLYRRLDRIQAQLRASLEARGVDRTVAVDMLSGDFTW